MVHFLNILTKNSSFQQAGWSLYESMSAESIFLLKYFICLVRLVNRGCKLIGCGSAVPALKVSNDDLAKIVDTNDEWISVRTGIRNRRVLSGESSFDLDAYYLYRLSCSSL